MNGTRAIMNNNCYAYVQVQLKVYARYRDAADVQKQKQADESPPTSLPTCDSDAYLIRGFSASTNQRRDY